MAAVAWSDGWSRPSLARFGPQEPKANAHMLCAQFLLRKIGSEHETILPLPCRSWRCPYCAPTRRRQLMAFAAAGEPNKLLTLTVNANVGESSTQRRNMLHDAWKKLVKQILRQFALPPDRRWHLNNRQRDQVKERQVRSITAKTAQAEYRQMAYFAFLERTKRGEPHLHILLRCPFIPQDWLSERMASLAGSPVLWIEAIKGTKHAIAYVTKYVTKEPAQWGNTKRYWASRNWRVNQGEGKYEKPIFDRPVEVVRERWADFIQFKVSQGWTWNETEGWYSFYRPGTRERAPDRWPAPE